MGEWININDEWPPLIHDSWILAQVTFPSSKTVTIQWCAGEDAWNGDGWYDREGNKYSRGNISYWMPLSKERSKNV